MPLTAAESVACAHCGTPFEPDTRRTKFCCAGCEFVHNLILKNGLDRFYELRGGTGLPARSLVFTRRDYSWISDLMKNAEASGRSSLTLELQGISCIGCVWLVEKLFMRTPGALAVEVNSALGQVKLRWKSGACDLPAFAADLQSFGYLLGPVGEKSAPRISGLVKRIGLCAAFALNAMLFSVPRYLGMDQGFQYAPLFDRLALLFATLSFLTGGTYFFSRTWASLRSGALHIDLPISIGLIAAYAGSLYAWQVNAMNFAYFDFVSTFSFLMLVGRWVQQSAIEKNRSRLLSLHDNQLFVMSLDGAKMSASELRPGVSYFVATGKLVPVRSKLLSAAATLSLEWINGESEPRAANAGRILPAGAINGGNGTLQVEAIEGWNQSLLARLMQVVPRVASGTEAGERFIKGYIIVVLGVAIAGFAGWLIAGHAMLAALQVLISVLVVSCPCASGVAIPLADEIATSALRRMGIFIREQSLWSRINKVRKIIFDKTGTLTLETMTLRNPEALDALEPAQKSVLLQMVSENLHPVSCCLRELLMAQGVEAARDGEVREHIGDGLELRGGADVWRLGRPDWAGAALKDCVFALNGSSIATFSFAEQPRADAAAEIALLRSRGYRVDIVSGDRGHKVSAMAQQLGLPDGNYHGEMSPAEKADWVRSIDACDTLMIGDGANDSLAFNESLCTGTPAIDRGLLEHKSDFYFVGRGLNGVRHLLDSGLRRRDTVRSVLAFAVAYNIVVVVISLAGKMSPLAAAVLMPLSSLASLATVWFGLGARWTGRPSRLSF
jgi:Cu2+-exporting ATPase